MLEHLGLGPLDERLYCTILESPRSADDLADLADGVGGDDVRRALERLAGHALVAPVDGGRWTALPADAALARLHAERVAALERERRALDDGRARLAEFLLLTVPRDGRGDGFVEVVRGNAAVGARVLQVVDTATKVVRVLDRPPYVYNVPEDGATLAHELRLLTAGVSYRVLYDADAFTPPELSECLAESLAAGEEARVLRDVPVKLVIADDDVAILPLVPAPGEQGCAVVLHTSLVVAPLMALFDSLWDRGVPVGSAETAGSVRPVEPTADERTLIMLLAAGMKDGAVARHLRISERTANRRISELIDRLDAHTRFQAGIQAARRGWL
ncbi:MAG: hypothetical protein QOE45_2343 [Frankiaceae bacterium]|jgi:DNA-binding CsgD family transcriptional regulator|nr:hypothetical protein [Frankiaceae bacterium]